MQIPAIVQFADHKRCSLHGEGHSERTLLLDPVQLCIGSSRRPQHIYLDLDLPKTKKKKSLRCKNCLDLYLVNTKCRWNSIEVTYPVTVVPPPVRHWRATSASSSLVFWGAWSAFWSSSVWIWLRPRARISSMGASSRSWTVQEKDSV